MTPIPNLPQALFSFGVPLASAWWLTAKRAHHAVGARACMHGSKWWQQGATSVHQPGKAVELGQGDAFTGHMMH